MTRLLTHRSRLAASAVAAVGLVVAAAPAWAATTTVTVNEASLGNDWTLYADNGGSGAFVNGPGTPPAGSGSFEINVPDGGKVTLSTNTVAREPLSAVDHVSYSTYRSSTSTMPSNVVPALNMEICADGITDGACTNSSYTTLVYEPLYAYGNDAIHNDTWQTWDALATSTTGFGGGWWSSRPLAGTRNRDGGIRYLSLDTIEQDFPEAAILSFGVNVGHGPSGTFEGNADALTLGLNGNTTVYDFEHAAYAATNPCVNDGWASFSSPAFRNFGDCVSYFASGGKTHPNG